MHSITREMSTPAEKAMAAGINVELVMDDGLVQAAIVLDTIKNVKLIPIRDDDILLCTYPKSGTHWTWEIINMIVAGKAEYTKHWQNSAWLEYRTEEELETLASPRVLHTHLLPRQLPESVWKLECKIVLVQRNPKDCAVSCFCQDSSQIWKDDAKDTVGFTGSWDDYLSCYQDGYMAHGSIFNYICDWWKTAEQYSICQVQYKDMKQNCVNEVRRMAEYLDRPLPEKTYVEIAEACSFINLKHANEKIKDQTYHFQWQQGTSGYFRNGKTGDWKNYFTVAQSEKFEKIYEAKLNKPFPY
ncbi:sulfotransferase 1B1-like isoform X2 [Haliotis rubra]|uniref:sulfotransferase 1B1-like isoform X2 n=1 Tax=Haliotis rubra TaxID=36100 RepID=UPI001EE57633|nr:sulfotransferase 1B1-like isoform X2 [Haliotis rubra]